METDEVYNLLNQYADGKASVEELSTVGNYSGYSVELQHVSLMYIEFPNGGNELTLVYYDRKVFGSDTLVYCDRGLADLKKILLKQHITTKEPLNLN